MRGVGNHKTQTGTNKKECEMKNKTLDGEAVFEDILTFARQIKEQKSGEFSPPEDIIRQMREACDAQLLGNLDAKFEPKA